MLDQGDEPLRVDVPAPVVPALGRVRTVRHEPLAEHVHVGPSRFPADLPSIEHCVHREDDAPCGKCAEIRAAERRLRAVSEIPALFAGTPSALDVLRDDASYYESAARNHEQRALAVGAGESRREHEQRAAMFGAVAKALRVVLGLHESNVPAGKEGEQSR